MGCIQFDTMRKWRALNLSLALIALSGCVTDTVLRPPEAEVLVDGFTVRLTTDAFILEPIFAEHIGDSDPLRDDRHFARHIAAVEFVTGCDLSNVEVEHDLPTGLSIFEMPLLECIPGTNDILVTEG